MESLINDSQNSLIKDDSITLELGKEYSSEDVSISLEMPFNDVIDTRLSEIDNKLDDLSRNIDKWTSNADAADIIVAASSGILASIIDILFIKEFDFDNASKWSDKKVENFVKKVAQIKGYKGNDSKSAIRYLEKFGTPSDSVANVFGGGKQHHLRDFAHHFSLLGLIFSIISQFTEKAYGTDTSGTFIVENIKDKTFIGDTIPKKMFFGLVFWIFHMASDMAGSSSALRKGTGVPGPLLSIVKILSSLPIFKNQDGINKLSLNVSKLFNGTLLADRDENGHIAKGANGEYLTRQIDFRGELACLHELAKMSIPVIINEVIVRGFYFVSRLIEELKTKEENKGINWEKTFPINNRTIVKMLTCATGVMSLIDTADSLIEGAIHSKGSGVEFGKQFFLRLNFVGLGRFIVSVGTDVVMGVKKSK